MVTNYVESQIDFILKSHLIPETPLISTIMMCGRLVAIKLVFAKIGSTIADANAFGIGCTNRLSQIKNEVNVPKEQRIIANDCATFEVIASSYK